MVSLPDVHSKLHATNLYAACDCAPGNELLQLQDKQKSLFAHVLYIYFLSHYLDSFGVNF